MAAPDASPAAYMVPVSTEEEDAKITSEEDAKITSEEDEVATKENTTEQDGNTTEQDGNTTEQDGNTTEQDEAVRLVKDKSSSVVVPLPSVVVPLPSPVSAMTPSVAPRWYHMRRSQVAFVALLFSVCFFSAVTGFTLVSSSISLSPDGTGFSPSENANISGILHWAALIVLSTGYTYQFTTMSYNKSAAGISTVELSKAFWVFNLVTSLLLDLIAELTRYKRVGNEMVYVSTMPLIDQTRNEVVLTGKLLGAVVTLFYLAITVFIVYKLGSLERQLKGGFLRQMMIMGMLLLSYMLNIARKFGYDYIQFGLPMCMVLLAATMFIDRKNKNIRSSIAYVVALGFMVSMGPPSLGAIMLIIVTALKNSTAWVFVLAGYFTMNWFAVEVFMNFGKRATPNDSDFRFLAVFVPLLLDDLFLDLTFAVIQPFSATFFAFQGLNILRVIARDGFIISSLYILFKSWRSNGTANISLLVEKAMLRGRVIRRFNALGEICSDAFVLSLLLVESTFPDSFPRLLTAGRSESDQVQLVLTYTYLFVSHILIQSVVEAFVFPWVRRKWCLSPHPSASFQKDVESLSFGNKPFLIIITMYGCLTSAMFALPVAFLEGTGFSRQ